MFGLKKKKQNKGLMTEENIGEYNDGMKSGLEEEKKLKKLLAVILAVIVGLFLVVLFLVLICKSVYSIKEITIEGNISYDGEEILEKIGIKKGDVIFLTDEKKAADRLAKDFIKIYSVRIDRIYPSSVNIVIAEEKPQYRLESAGFNVVVSESGKVLYVGKTFPDEYGSLLLVKLPGIERAVEGYRLSFASEADAIAVNAVLRSLEVSSIREKIVLVDISSRFDIKLQYEDRFQILIGNKNDLSLKLKFASGIIEELTSEESGTINVKNGGKGYVILKQR